jgi:hypothetical protein
MRSPENQSAGEVAGWCDRHGVDRLSTIVGRSVGEQRRQAMVAIVAQQT